MRSAGVLERPLADATSDRISFRLLAFAGFADVGYEFGEVPLGLVDRVLAHEFGSERYLQ